MRTRGFRSTWCVFSVAGDSQHLEVERNDEYACVDVGHIAYMHEAYVLYRLAILRGGLFCVHEYNLKIFLHGGA